MSLTKEKQQTQVRSYAYVRVSTLEQNEDRQLDAMHRLGIQDMQIYVEKRSGKDFERPEYKKMVKKMKEGDQLFILSIDRLGRNYDEIREQWRILTKVKKVNVVVVDMPLLDTRQYKDLVGTLISDLVLELLAYVAESERASIRERTRQGLQAAKTRGVRLGRPQMEFDEEFTAIYRAWKEGAISLGNAARQAGLAQSTLRYRMRIYEERQGEIE